MKLFPTVSVVICTYSHQRWDTLLGARASLRAQTHPPLETIVVVDHNEPLLERARSALAGVEVVANTGERGLAGARNAGVKHARGDVVAFLDDDAIAQRTWVEALISAYADDSVLGTGGWVDPTWEGGLPPRWLPAEFYWTVGCSYRGLPVARAAIRNPIGANMSFRRTCLEDVGGFQDGIGRVGKTPLGCEETELSIRVHGLKPDGVILHLPDARVGHRVPVERASWAYFRARCWAEGVSKALVAKRAGAGRALASERAYTLTTLPAGVLRGLVDCLRGDLSGLLRAGAILAGLGITTAGYVRARFEANV
jgi:glycosyltransferase involved in cell wall biosynthesis